MITSRFVKMQITRRYSTAAVKRSSRPKTNQDFVLCKRHEGKDTGIVEISLNREPNKLNALNTPLVTAIIDTLSGLKNDDDSKVLILRSNIKKAFCTGLDLKEGGIFGDLLRDCWQMIWDVIHFPKPTISAVDGLAIGGGLELALGCDVIVGSDNMRAGMVESKLGLVPGGGGHYNITKLIGSKRAKEIIYTAELLKGQYCYDIGMIQHLAKQNKENNAAYLKAMDIARKITPQSSQALEKAKILVNSAQSDDFGTSFEQEHFDFLSLQYNKDTQNRIRHFVN